VSAEAERGPRAVLEVRDLETSFVTEGETARAVDGVSFDLFEGRTLGLVGESGCGKSATALSILRLVPPPGRVTAGSIRLRGRELLALDEDEMRAVRGAEIAMVFQEPMSALNPVFTVGWQVAESLVVHRHLARSDAQARAVELLAEVGIADPALRARQYPHQLSGGMRQRAMIAMAMACGPAVLLADEPTSALDVTVQAQILELFGELQRKAGTALLLITHDLAVVAEAAERVAVMYAGRIVEHASALELFEAPRHPYTIGLLRSLPERTPRGRPLAAIPGVVPSALEWPSGCRFRTRCPLARAACAESEPALEPAGTEPGHLAACHFKEEAARL
jgi:oligopeptide/dipeptide ABC transporter ATP-binding protein